jgi:poly(A) polymerase
LSPAASAADAAAERIHALLKRPGAAALLAALQDGDHEARIVGGAVRDALMGRIVEDLDIATTCPPHDVMAIARDRGWKAVPTGIEHGTVTVVIDHVRHEVTTLRRDVETDGRRAVIAFTTDFSEDARRRDFTMNALSLSADGVVHDYATGIADAAAGLVRFMGDPETRIREDYLRILRFFRFQASHGRGAPQAAGLAACAVLKDGLLRLSRERLRQELLKLLAAPGAVAAAEAMEGIGLWPRLLKDVAFDVGALRRLAALEEACGLPPDAIRRLAAGAEAVDALQGQLALSRAEAVRLAAARNQASPVTGPAMAEPALRGALFLAGFEGFRDAALVAAARGGWDAAAAAALVADAEAMAARLPANPFSSADAAALGVRPGPAMGRVLKAATEAWLAAGLPEERQHQRAILEAARAAAG